VSILFDTQQLSVAEAVQIFKSMPSGWQLASLHPRMVEIDATRDGLFKPTFWCFRAKERCLLHSFQLVDTPALNLRDIQSAYGYGGPISNSDDPSFLRQALNAQSKWASNNGVIAEFLRFHPLVPHERWFEGKIAANRQTVHIDLTGELFDNYEGRRRTDVRRFLKSGIDVRKVSPDTMLGSFPEMYKRNMEHIGAAESYFFPAAYFDVLCNSELVENWLAYRGDRVVAGAVFLISRAAGIVEYFLGAKILGFDEYKPMVGLLHVAAQYYREQSFRYLFLGGGRSADLKDSLLSFKRGFSPLVAQFRIGSRVFDGDSYARLAEMLPKKAESGRVLFYRD
jgi:hypothetical protein